MIVSRRIIDAGPETMYYVKSDIDKLLHKDSIEILKRIRRRMQMKSVRLVQLARKLALKRGIAKGSGGGAHLIMRAHTWEYACALIDEEIGALECQIKKINN